MRSVDKWLARKPGKEIPPLPHSLPEAADVSLLISCGFYFLIGYLDQRNVDQS